MKRMKLNHPLGALRVAAMLAVCAMCLPAHGSPGRYYSNPDAPLPKEAIMRIGTIGYNSRSMLRTNAAVSPDFKFVLIEQPGVGSRRLWELWDLETKEKKIISNKLSDYGEEEELREMLPVEVLDNVS